MKQRRFLHMFTMGIMVLAFLPLVSCRPQDKYVRISGFAQGGIYNVTLNLNGYQGLLTMDEAELQQAVDSILLDIDNSLSGYNRNSLLTHFNAGEAVLPTEVFIDLYEKSYRIYEETEGVVDVASGPLFDAWGFGFRSGELPSDEVVDSLRAACGMGLLKSNIRYLVLPDGRLYPESLLKDAEIEAMPVLNYNAVAQGYSCDRVAAYLQSLGVKDMLVDIGEIYCQGLNPHGKSWTLAIDTPTDGNEAPGTDICGVFSAPARPCGIVTSGNYRKFYVRDGRKYAHTIDPRTGRPVEHNLLSATVIAKDGFTADAYATYCMVVGLEEAQAFVEAHQPEVEACLVYDDEGAMRTWVSSGFNMND